MYSLILKTLNCLLETKNIEPINKHTKLQHETLNLVTEILKTKIFKLETKTVRLHENQKFDQKKVELITKKNLKPEYKN